MRGLVPATVLLHAILLATVGSAQTLTPPKLVCANNEITGDVTLTWTVPSNPCGPFLGYEIWGSNSPGGPYTLLTTIPSEFTTSWLHIGADGITTTWYYYLVPVWDCPGWATTTSDTLDNLDPEPPVIDYVTVVPGGVEINWLPSTSPETWAYIIYRQVAGLTPIDTVFGRFTTTYIDAAPRSTPNPRPTRSPPWTPAGRSACFPTPFTIRST